jgi:hypothetical protein
MDQNKDFLNVVLNNKRALAEIFLATILMSIGINILASIIIQQVKGDRYILFIGLDFIVLAVFFFFFPIVKNLKFRRSYDGFFVVDQSNGHLRNVYRYDYASKITRWINELRQSAPLVDQQWQRHPVPEHFDLAGSTPEHEQASSSLHLLQQATEVYVLSRITNHLHDYFHKNPDDASRLTLIPESRLPLALNKNPFLPLGITRQLMPEEEVLGEEENEDLHSQEKAPLSSQISIAVPRGATIKWLPNRGIKISNRRLSLVSRVKLSGRPFYLPAGFQQNYMGIRQDEQVMVYAATVEFEMNFSYMSIFSSGYWKFYYWLDACMRHFEKGFVGGTFFNTIGWDKTMTLIACQNQARQQSNRLRQQQGHYPNQGYQNRTPPSAT